MLTAQILIVLSALAGIVYLARKNPFMLKTTRVLAGLAMLALFVWLMVEGRVLQSCPLSDAWGVLAMVGVILIALSGWVSLRYKFPGVLTGVMALLAAAIVLGRIFFPPPGAAEIKISWMLGLHILVASAGFSVLAIGCISGILILVRTRVLKSVKWSTQSNTAWPSLTALDRVFTLSLELGVILLTLGVALGVLFAPGAGLQGVWYLDPKVITSALGLGLYALVFALRRKRGFFSWPIVAAATLGFVFVLLGFFLSNYFTVGFHRF